MIIKGNKNTMEMDQNRNGFGHSENCRCQSGMGSGMCRMCSFGHRFVLLRWLLGIIILGLVFWVGLMIGEFHGMYGDSFGRGYGMGSGHHRMMRYDQRVMPMMQSSGYPGGMMMENGGQGMAMPPQSSAVPAPTK